jgi:hypothetical protein
VIAHAEPIVNLGMEQTGKEAQNAQLLPDQFDLID